ncbi:MAG: HD domain-containing protein [Angelakisella sp.]
MGGINSGLMKISPYDFTVGMYVGTDLFVERNDNLLLLCSHATLTEDLVAKLMDFAADGNDLYLDSAYYQQMGRHYKVTEPPSREQRAHDKQCATMTQLLEVISKTDQVPWQLVDQMVTALQQQMDDNEPAVLLQCIGVPHQNDLGTHSLNVALLSGLLARWLKLAAKPTQQLITIGLLHDVGKTRISPELLNKATRLTSAEFALLRKHPLYSQEILSHAGMSDSEILSAVRSHHEMLNGSGYPDGLKVDKIPEFSKLLAITDSYVGLVQKQIKDVYLSPFVILGQFATDKFSMLDFRYANIFLTQVGLAFVGKLVRLSDNSIGTVLYVDREKMAYPIVERNGQAVPTSPELYCITLLN